jgi:hypothetical protein
VQFAYFKTALLVIATSIVAFSSADAGQSYQKKHKTHHVHRQVYHYDSRSLVRHDDRHPVRRVEYRHVERPVYRRPAYRHVERPVYRHVYRELAAPVFYNDGTLVGRDPDANVRLMLSRDNAKTLWAR